jgi:hypothetical protein
MSNDKKRKTPGVVIAHRVFSVVAICFGLMWLGIGISLMQDKPPAPREYFSSGPGSVRLVSYHSSERDKAPTYVAIGLAIAAVFAAGLFLKAGVIAYVYHSILLVLLVLLWGIGLILAIWWFRKRTRDYYCVGRES